MNIALGHGAGILSAIVFVGLYTQFLGQVDQKTSLKFGLWVALLMAIPFSIGTYAYMPITITIAVGWFVSTMLKYTVASLITHRFTNTTEK